MKNYYLNKKNIQAIKKDNNNQVINIIQKNKAIEYFSLCGLYNSTISMIVIDGEVVKNCENVKLESSAIKEMSILKEGKANDFFCTSHNDIIIINTK